MNKKTTIEDVAKIVSPDGWTYRWNDQPVTQEQYQKLDQDHRTWVEEQNRSTTTETKKKRTKNT